MLGFEAVEVAVCVVGLDHEVSGWRSVVGFAGEDLREERMGGTVGDVDCERVRGCVGFGEAFRVEVAFWHIFLQFLSSLSLVGEMMFKFLLWKCYCLRCCGDVVVCSGFCVLDNYVECG